MKALDNYSTPPRSAGVARNRAMILKRWLENNAGGRWSARVWENSGWHYSVRCGTICVSVNYHYTVSGLGYSILNRGDSDHLDVGHGSLFVYHPSGKQLLRDIKRSLKDHRELVLKNIAAYNLNRKLNGFKPAN